MDASDSRARLLALADARRVSLAALSALIGRNPAYLQQFIRKGSPRRLAEGDRQVLARFFGVREAELDEAPPVGVPKLGDSQAGWVDIPRLALDASAGPGAWVDGGRVGGGSAGAEAPFGTLRFTLAWLRALGLDPARLAGLAVAGDSMAPTLHDGDEILVERFAEGGAHGWRDGVHVVRLDSALLVKRLARARAGHIALISDNPAYRPLELAAPEVVVIGRVVWRGGRL